MTMLCHETKYPGTEEFLDGFVTRAERLRIPLSGSLELTRRCNLNCVHCYLGPQAGRQPLLDLEMGASRIRSLLDEMTEAGCLNLLITGGEPLLRDDFPEIYRHAKENGLLVTVFTNGTIVTEKIIELFCDLPPVEAEISIYGATALTYENITRIPGSYERCLNGIRGLLENGIRVNLKTILMTINSHEFVDMENLAKDFGVRFRFDSAISPCIDGDNAPLSLRVPPEEAMEKEISGPEKLQNWVKYFYKSKDCRLGLDMYGCNAGVTAFHLDPFGCIQPCIMTLDIKYDISTESFMTGWNNIIQRIRNRKVTADFVCRGCEKINFCGYCPAFFRLENGLEDVRSEYLCQVGNLLYQHICETISKGDHGG